MVKSEKIYSPQNYLELVTGNCYIIKGCNDIETIECVLEDLGYNLRSYSLSEISHIVEEELNVVLVDCMVCNDDTDEFEHVYRWFEVDSEDEDDKYKEELNMRYYILQYINDCGDTIARDYFDNKEEALKFMEGLVKTYKREGADTALRLEDSNGKLITYYEPEDEDEDEKYVVYDEEQDCYVCPQCGEYIADRFQIKDLDYDLPKYCHECGTKLHY